MKKFFKYVFAVFTGTFLGLLAFFLIVLLLIGGTIALLSDKEVKVPENSVLFISLHEQIAETTHINPFDAYLPGRKTSTLGITDICSAILAAAHDDAIKGIVLVPGMIQANYPSVHEIATALVYFKKQDKFVYSFADMYTQKAYIIASYADKIFMNPEGMFELRGIASQVFFFKDLLEKIGIEPVEFRTGTYKSFSERFMRSNLSDDNRAQISAYIHDVWDVYTNTISQNRPQISTPLSDLANGLLVWNAEQALKYGLIDKIGYYDEFLDEIRAQLSLQETDKIPHIQLSQYVLHRQQAVEEELKNKKASQKPIVALIIAEGGIDMGEDTDNTIGAAAYSRMLRQARQDTTVKAIVFRINSGGGSALASEIIWREAQRAAETKPLIVSFGDMAASGGYYIAVPARVIVAQESTLTGSIGVVGVYMKTISALGKIGISVDTVKTNTYADIGSTTRDLYPRELEVVGENIDDIYATFKMRVANGRSLDLSFVESIAEGRIWSGKEALALGLIDTIGTVITAIELAAQHADIEDSYRIVTYPKKLDFKENLLKKLSGEDAFYAKVKEIFGEQAAAIYSQIQQAPKEPGIYMQLPYSLVVE